MIVEALVSIGLRYRWGYGQNVVLAKRMRDDRQFAIRFHSFMLEYSQRTVELSVGHGCGC